MLKIIANNIHWRWQEKMKSKRILLLALLKFVMYIPCLYIFTALFYLLLWVRSMEVHLILNVFTRAPIQIMNREKFNFRSYSSLAVWIFPFQCWYAFTMFVYISLKKLLWVYITCLLSLLSWVSASSFSPQDVMKFLPSIEPIAVSF